MFDFYINQLDAIVQEITLSNHNEYPDMKQWYDSNYSRTLENLNSELYEPNLSKRIDEIRSRPFLLYIERRTLSIVGVCLMKNTLREQKISILYVVPNHRNIGIASDILKRASKILVDKPVAQLSEQTFKKFPEFAILFSRFGYKFTGRENTYDRVDNDEMYFTFKKSWKLPFFDN